MRLMKQCVLPVHIGIAYQKNSPLTLTVNGWDKNLEKLRLTNERPTFPQTHSSIPGIRLDAEMVAAVGGKDERVLSAKEGGGEQ